MPEVKIEQKVITDVNKSQFTGMAFVGVKKVEYFAKEQESVMFSDVMELLENRTYANNLMLGFFSTKPFGNEEYNKIDSIISMNEDANELLIKQALKKVALFDFSEISEPGAGLLNIVVVADAIIHWDSEGSYIQTTQDNSLDLDLEDIVKAYPKSYKIVIYTERDLSSFTYREFEKKPVFEIPLKSNMWYNQPTLQEVYGNMVLTAGIISLALAYGVITWQKGIVEDYRAEISASKAKKVDEAFYTRSNIDFKNLQNSTEYKKLTSIITKDISNSLNAANFKLNKISFEIDNKSQIMFAKISSKRNSHTQFSSQEPLARDILNKSRTIKAIKKVTTNEPMLVLEALIDLKDVKQGLKNNKKGA